MAYHIGDCPKCNARLLIEYKDANDYYDADLTSSTIDLTYHARCWKCGAIVRAVICSNIEEQPMSIEEIAEEPEVADIIFNILPTRDLSKAEAMEAKKKTKKTAITVHTSVVTKDGHGREPYFRHH